MPALFAAPDDPLAASAGPLAAPVAAAGPLAAADPIVTTGPVDDASELLLLESDLLPVYRLSGAAPLPAPPCSPVGTETTLELLLFDIFINQTNLNLDLLLSDHIIFIHKMLEYKGKLSKNE